MAIAEDYAWKSAIVRVTLVIVAITAAFVLLDVVWPETPGTLWPLVLFSGLMTVGITLGPAFRDKIVPLAPAVILVGLIVGQAWPLASQPAWAYHLSTAFAGWVGCLAVIWVSQLRARRRRAKAIASSSPSRTTHER
ncbi:hypothetical protein ACPPVO_54125 [Dactylosporangium sp. McL0621]|uniref:hypothetical protein n=1 Tax=Dactylosporangium sp. McL0621 TaxID=3415678 RepID=UPI003CF7D07B